MNKARLLAFACLGLLGHLPLCAQDDLSQSLPPEKGAPGLIEHIVHTVLNAFGIQSSGTSLIHWCIFAGLIILSYVIRKFITTALFRVLRKFASKTETTLDDKLFPALEGPCKGLIFVFGTFTAFKVLKLAPSVDSGVSFAYKVAFPAVVFWGVIKTIDAVIDHLGEMGRSKGMGIAAFLPLIKKTVVVIFVILGALTIIQSFGYDVKAFLTGLGIGGLACALAAQDTIANLFGSFVVAIDQPFHVGDTVTIGSYTGKVEGIGMRSTRLRTPERTLIAIPNRTVANEAITNLTRMPQRRVDQTLGLTYDTTPDQLEAFINDVREILKAEPGVHQESIVVNFVDYGPSSLDIKVIYFSSDPDYIRHLQLRERVNMRFMRAVAARNLSFAFPTQTIQLEGPVARSLAKARA